MLLCFVIIYKNQCVCLFCFIDMLQLLWDPVSFWVSRTDKKIQLTSFGWFRFDVNLYFVPFVVAIVVFVIVVVFIFCNNSSLKCIFIFFIVDLIFC